MTHDEARAICQEVERTMWRRRLRQRCSPRHVWFQVKRRFPNIGALERERNDLRSELVQDRTAPVRDVIRELDEDIRRARAASWPHRGKGRILRFVSLTIRPNWEW